MLYAWNDTLTPHKSQNRMEWRKRKTNSQPRKITTNLVGVGTKNSTIQTRTATTSNRMHKLKIGAEDDEENRTMQLSAEDVNCQILEILSLKLQKPSSINSFSASCIYDDPFSYLFFLLLCLSLHTFWMRCRK